MPIPVNGLLIALASAFGTVVNMTAITNASEAVATLDAGHGVTAGDYVQVVTSGWDGLVGSTYRAKTVATNNVTLEGLDTTSTALYPAAGGVGTVRKISTWTNVTRFLDISTEGGEQQFGEYQYVTEGQSVSFPTVVSGSRITLTVHDDTAQAYWPKLVAAAGTNVPVPARFTYANGYKKLFNAYWSYTRFPTHAKNDMLQRKITLTVATTPVDYTS